MRRITELLQAGLMGINKLVSNQNDAEGNANLITK